MEDHTSLIQLGEDLFSQFELRGTWRSHTRRTKTREYEKQIPPSTVGAYTEYKVTGYATQRHDAHAQTKHARTNQS